MEIDINTRDLTPAMGHCPPQVVASRWSVQHAKRFKGFGKFARKAPYVSSVLLIAMGGFFMLQGWRHLP